MLTVSQKAYVNLAEFLALPESMAHVELVEGEVVLAPAPHPRHQQVSVRLFRTLDAWAVAHPPAWAVYAPIDVLFGEDTVLQPDLALFLSHPGDAQPLQQIPELVVEILSANRAYDRMAKRLMYMRAGVREYWMVDPHLRCVELSTSLTQMVTVGDRMESRLAAGWSVPVQDLWRP
ncbi:MAG: Uma2 family endonuclease [Deltaproteobacteria bacterium]|nr:Uma2 family endonuclease [Deltaproteobacteria bacterium]